MPGSEICLRTTAHPSLLAYIRIALAFAGLGFTVAKFGLSPKIMRVSGYLGTFTVLVGLLVVIIGLAQHRAVLRKVEPLPGGLASRGFPMLPQLSEPGVPAGALTYRQLGKLTDHGR